MTKEGSDVCQVAIASCNSVTFSMFFALFKCFFIVEGRPIWTRRAKTVPNLIGKSIKIETEFHLTQYLRMDQLKFVEERLWKIEADFIQTISLNTLSRFSQTSTILFPEFWRKIYWSMFSQLLYRLSDGLFQVDP